MFVICMDRVSRCTMGTAPTRLGVSCYPVRANISRSCSQVRVQQSMSLKGRLVQHQQVFILILHWTTVVKGELSVKTKLYTIYFKLLVDFFISPRRSWRMFCLACCNKLPKNRLTVKRRHIDVFHCIQLLLGKVLHGWNTLQYSPTAEHEGQHSNWTPIHCKNGNSLDVLQ